MADEHQKTLDPEKIMAEGRIIDDNAPMLHVTAVRVSADSNEVGIVLQNPKRFLVEHPTEGTLDVAKLETLAFVGMSPQTAKDLYLVLGDILANHEKEFGEIVTAYTKRRAATSNA